MKSFSILKIFFVFSLFVNNINGAKILSIFGYPGPSQYIMATALLKGLAEQGHEVTSISTFPQKQPIKNFRDIAVMENAHLFDEMMSQAVGGAEEQSFFEMFNEVSVTGSQMVTNVLENPQVKDLMKNEKFDLLIVEIFMTDALLGLGEHFGAPIVGVSTFGTMSFIDNVVGNTSPSSYIPHMALLFPNQMSLKQRLLNVLTNAAEELMQKYVISPVQENLYKKYFPSATLTFEEARKNVALVLLNQHFSLSFPRPYVPNMIEVGGLHIKQKPDALPEDLQQFLDNATEGAIFFSMGSNLKSKDLPVETLTTFIDTFRELNVKVLWKFEDESLPNIPDNVLIRSWYPQPSILAHRNVKLFISHGGFLSTTETIFHAKPILGIPVFGDQPMNVEQAVREGYALSLKLDDINKESFKATIEELLTNSSYTNTIQKLSQRYRDQPQTPLEKAIYWIEYVLRHEGADHMSVAGKDLNFWQYHNIDVFTILIGGVLFLIWIIIFTINLLRQIWCSKKPKSKQRKTKRN